MKSKLILSSLAVLVVACGYLLLEPVMIDCGRLTVTTEETTQGDIPEYRSYTYGSHDYESYTFNAYWPSGQKRIIPFHPSMVLESDFAKFDQIGKHDIEVSYQKGKTTLKIEVVLPNDPDHHILIFDSTGGSDVNDIIDIPHGTTVQLPVPEKSGYDFLGWYTTQDASGDRIDDTTPIHQSMILYAKWEVPLS